MARELVDEIRQHNEKGEATRAILPCGPSCWYAPFTDLVNREKVSLENLVVFHMDECLDWQGRELPRAHPYSFRGFMERHFYDPVEPGLRVPQGNRVWLNAGNIEAVRRRIWEAPDGLTAISLTAGGARTGTWPTTRPGGIPSARSALEDLRSSSIRIQENNLDTILALAQRTFGAAYQFVPPMSVTLGMKEVLAARKIRLFSDTGAWKQTALRVALFGPVTPEYPITLLQDHPDVLLTATVATAKHPISEHPEWDLGL